MKEMRYREGGDLLGRPNFEELENGRFKCVETGHEMLSLAMDSYANTKRCRMALIDCALSRKKPPLNMFIHDPLSSSKLICTLTGDKINKSEEHIWKHINGKQFLSKLEKVEVESLNSNGVRPTEPMVSKLMADESKKSKSKKKMKPGVKRNGAKEEEEGEFWMPPVGSRRDLDDGRDGWDSDSDNHTTFDDDDENGCVELSMGTKRMSIEAEPSRAKKKSKIANP